MLKAFGIGRFCADPEAKTLPSGKVVAKFRLAFNRRPYRDGKTGELVKETTFIDCEAWEKTGELVAQHFAQGKLMTVTGAEVLQDNWTDQQSGQKRSKLYLRVTEFDFVPGEKREGDDAPPADGPPPTARKAPPPRKRPAAPPAADDGEGVGGVPNDVDDSGIPF